MINKNDNFDEGTDEMIIIIINIFVGIVIVIIIIIIIIMEDKVIWL